MKRISAFLVLLVLVSCARRPPKYDPVAETPPARTGVSEPRPLVVAPPTNAVAATKTDEVRVPELSTGKTNQLVTVPATNAPTRAAVGLPMPPPGGAPAPIEPASAAANEPTLPAGTLDLRNMPLDQALEVYAELVNRTLLRPAALPAQQITLRTQTPLTRSEAIQALDAVLALNGIAMVNFGEKFVKVVAEPQAGTTGAPMNPRDPSTWPELGSFVTHVVQLKYIKPTEAVPILMPFAKIPNSILPVDTSQVLVLRDYTENVKRMLEMIDRIDVMVPAEFDFIVLPIKYAKANEIADALNSLGGGGGGGAPGASRSSSSPARGGPGTGAQRSPGMPGASGYMQPGATTPYGSAQGGIPGAGGAGGGSTVTDRIRNIIQRATAQGDLQIIGQNKIVADERSNSLLIFAGKQDMIVIKNIVSKLDVVLSQVIIDSIIMDVSLNDAKALGFSAIQKPKNLSPNAVGAGAMNAQTFFDFANSGNTNVFNQLLGSGVRYFAKVDEQWLLQVQAAVSDGRVNVIQKPRIVTSHAKAGSILVGGTVPYITGTYYNGGYGGGPSSQYQQLFVGISLIVTPFVNPDGLVVMEIDETIDELAGTTDLVGVGAVPNTTHRALTAEVAVRDGESIMLGGFVRNATTKNRSGVPVLMDVPLLGALFQSKSSSKEQKELLVLMRPTVLRTPEIAATTTAAEKNNMPGIIGAEAEAEADQQKELARQRKKIKNLGVTPEEKKAFQDLP